MLRLLVLMTIVFAPSTALAQRNPRGDVEGRGVVRPSPEAMNPEFLRKSTGAFAAWGSDEDKRLVSRSYRMVLKFAECVSRFNSHAADRVLNDPIGDLSDGMNLRRLASRNPGCAVEHMKVHPLLLRAALAETMIEGSQNSSSAPPKPLRVGVPEVVDGYPLAKISRCQVRFAPELVAELLRSDPGEASERELADKLFAQTPFCGASQRGRLSPTAARLALVDAAVRVAHRPR